MKTLLRGLKTALFAFTAILCGNAFAIVDEIGLEPLVWTTFDNQTVNNQGSVTSFSWGDNVVNYEDCGAGKAAYPNKYPYYNGNLDWNSATSFTLLGRFKAQNATDTYACLFGMGWNNECVSVGAKSGAVTLAWVGNWLKTADNQVIAAGSLTKEDITADLTGEYHNYALVYDHTANTLSLYLDGELALTKDNVKITLGDQKTKQGGIFGMGGGPISGGGPARNAATRCDDYRIYGVALNTTQLKRIAGLGLAATGWSTKADYNLTATTHFTTGEGKTAWMTDAGNESNGSNKSINNANGSGQTKVTFQDSNAEANKWHPYWSGLATRNQFSIAAYVKLGEQTISDSRNYGVLWAFGWNNKAEVVLAIDASGNLVAGNMSSGVPAEGQLATIAAEKVTAGWHLVTVEFSTEFGTALTLDGGLAEGTTAVCTVARTAPGSNGFQIGAVLGGVPGQCGRADNVGFSDIYYFDGLLAKGAVADLVTELAEKYPALEPEPEETSVAQVGEVKYETLAAAISAAEGGTDKTIVLLKTSNETITIPEGVTVETTKTAALSGTIEGAGTIVYDAESDSIAPTFTPANGWTGNVYLKNIQQSSGYYQLPFNSLGNASSSVTLENVTGYVGSGTINPMVVLVGDGWNLNAGGSSNVTIMRLAGSGTLTIPSSCTATQVVKITNDGFNGTISNQGNISLVFGEASENYDKNVYKGMILIDTNHTLTVGDGKTLSAIRGVKADGTLKFTEDASSLSAITRYNQFALSGSGLIDLSEAKGQSAGGNNLRIAIRGADHTFSGDVKVPANVNLVFAAADTDCTGMKFSGGGFVCVLGTAVNLDGTWTTQTGAYIGAVATLKANGGTLTGRLYFCDNTNLALGSLTETSLTVTGERFETAGTLHISLPSGTPSDDKVKLISWKKTQNVTAARLDVSNIPDGYEVTYDESGLYLGSVADSTVETTSAVSNRLTISNVRLGNGGVQKFTGTGGVLIDDLQIRDGGKIVVNPTRQPIKLSKAPVFEEGAKIALADEHASCKLGKFTLMTWSGDAVEIPEGLFDSSSFIASTTLVCEAAPESGCHQLTLKIGNYDENATVLRIMPLGDSITDGTSKNAAYECNPNYRVPLMKKLAAKGYRPVTSGLRECAFNNRYSTDSAGVIAPSEYRWHSGVSGARVRTSYRGDRGVNGGWREAIETTLDAAGDIDIITFKIGTNDAGDDKNLVFAAWKDVMWRILNARPKVKIVCASILNMNGNDVWESGYNKLIKDQIELDPTAEGAFPAGRVFYADLHDACPRTTDGVSNFTDAYHPNWIGHDRTSDAWLSAIEEAVWEMDIPVEEKTFERNTKTGAEENVPEAYRDGYMKLATKALPTTGQGSTMQNAAPEYDTVAEGAADLALERVAYYVELKNKKTGHVRYVWTSMDAFGDKTLAAVGIPTSYAKWGEVTNLRVVSNDTGIHTTAANAEGIKGRLQFTYGGAAVGGSVEGAPTQLAKWDWNDAINGSEASPSGTYGVMQAYRVFDNPETDQNVAETLFAYNRWSATDNKPTEIGIGNFAMHGAYTGGDTSNGSINYMHTSGYETVDASAYELMNLEIWGMAEAVETNAAEVGGVKYATLEEAIANLTGGETLTLLNDVELSATLDISTGKYGTLNLNGHAITYTGEGVALSFASGSEVTVTGEGSITADSGCAITSAGLTTISGLSGVPVIGGAKVTKGDSSCLTVDEAYLPQKPLVIDYDWTGTFMNSTMPRLSIAHTSDIPYSNRATYTFNPIREVEGVMYAATMTGGADTRPGTNGHILMVDYCYTVNEATIEIEHAKIPYVFGVQTDTSTGKMYTLKQKVMMVMGQPQYTTVTPEDISFRLWIDSGYQNPSVVANGETIEARDTGYYHIRPGATGTEIKITAEEIPPTPTYDEVTEETPLSDVVPAEQAEILEAAGVTADKVAKWAKDPEKGGFLGTATAGGAINLEAFALNCAPADLEAAKENFKISITVKTDGTVEVSAPEGYNIAPVIKGSATVDGKYELSEGDETARFFKAVIEF